MSLLSESAAAILTKFGTSIAGAAGSWVFQQGLDALNGGSDTTKINEAIAQVAKEVEKVDKDVQKLSHQLLTDVLALRTDELKGPMGQITGHYEDITQIVQTALKLSPTLSAADRKTQTKPIQDRLETVLKICANDVPGLLDTINGYLTETGDATGSAFLQQICQKTLDDADDFLGFYGRSKAIVMQYWIVFAKGISLLQMAFDVPDVGFVEGAAAVQKQTANLQKQDQVFRSTLGIQTSTIAEQVLTSGDPIYIPISLCDTTGSGLQWIQDLNGFAPRLWLVNSGTDTNTPTKTTWWIQAPKEAILEFYPTGSYAVHLMEDATNNRLVINDSDLVVTEVPESENTKYPSEWYIKPISPGSDQFTLQFQSQNTEYSGAYLVKTAWTTDQTWALADNQNDASDLNSVGKESQCDANNPSYQWQIAMWVDSPSASS